MDDPDAANQEVSVGRREDPRVRLRLGATLVTVTGTQAATLNNLSRGGASVSADPPPRRGADVILRLRDIEAFGTVTWVHGIRCGLKFDEPLTDKEVLSARSLSDNHASIQKAELIAAARDFAQGRRRTGTEE